MFVSLCGEDTNQKKTDWDASKVVICFESERIEKSNFLMLEKETRERERET